MKSQIQTHGPPFPLTRFLDHIGKPAEPRTCPLRALPRSDSNLGFAIFSLAAVVELAFPALHAGVFIHLHDVFYPFEYPEGWFFDENRSWNELCHIYRAAGGILCDT
jgi:hypothetical protein